jgi:flagellar protein FliT
MNHAPHLYFAWQQLVEKSQLMLRLATEEQWDELIASVCECGAGDCTSD